MNQVDTGKFIANCRKAFSDTIFNNQAINLEAFIDNLVK